MAGIGWSEIDAEERRRVEECFPVSISLINDLIRYDNGFVMPRSYPEKLEKGIYDFELRDDDIWIVTYPKCGTTWTQELVWNIVNGVQVSRIPEPLFDRSPFIDIPMIAQNVDTEEFYSKLENMPSPRVIKVENWKCLKS